MINRYYIFINLLQLLKYVIIVAIVIVSVNLVTGGNVVIQIRWAIEYTASIGNVSVWFPNVTSDGIYTACALSADS